MKIIYSVLLVAFSFMYSPRIRADCSKYYVAIKSYEDSNPSWKVLQKSDLPLEDQLMWKAQHRDECPGIFLASLGEALKNVHVIALIKKSDTGDKYEKLVVLDASGKELSIDGEKRVASPFVVWRAPPGRYYSSGLSEEVALKHDSIIYEKMEASSIQYYFSNGKLRSLVASE